LFFGERVHPLIKGFAVNLVRPEMVVEVGYVECDRYAGWESALDRLLTF
jgi:hypothetical protein